MKTATMGRRRRRTPRKRKKSATTISPTARPSSRFVLCWMSTDSCAEKAAEPVTMTPTPAGNRAHSSASSAST